MKIDPGIVARQWEQATVEQLSRDMERDGYEVERGVVVSGVRVDLFAKRGDEKILFEVKAPGSPDMSARLASVAKIQAVAKELGARFRLVVVRAPQETTIHIDGLETALSRYLTAHTPASVLALSRDAIVLGVEGIRLSALHYGNALDLSGAGDVILSLPAKSIDTTLPFLFEGMFMPMADRLEVMSLTAFELDLSLSN